MHNSSKTTRSCMHAGMPDAAVMSFLLLHLPTCQTSFSNISSVNFFLFFYAGISSSSSGSMPDLTPMSYSHPVPPQHAGSHRHVFLSLSSAGMKLCRTSQQWFLKLVQDRHGAMVSVSCLNLTCWKPQLWLHNLMQRRHAECRLPEPDYRMPTIRCWLSDKV